MLWWFPFVIVAGGVEGGMSGFPLLILELFSSACYYWSFMPWIMREICLGCQLAMTALDWTSYRDLIDGVRLRGKTSRKTKENRQKI